MARYMRFGHGDTRAKVREVPISEGESYPSPSILSVPRSEPNEIVRGGTVQEVWEVVKSLLETILEALLAIPAVIAFDPEDQDNPPHRAHPGEMLSNHDLSSRLIERAVKIV